MLKNYLFSANIFSKKMFLRLFLRSRKKGIAMESYGYDVCQMLERYFQRAIKSASKMCTVVKIYITLKKQM